MSITSWREPEAIFSMAKIIASGRCGYSEDDINAQITLLKQQYHADIYRLEMPLLEISSKSIRKRCVDHEPIRYYVPEEVFSYIEQHKLYL